MLGEETEFTGDRFTLNPSRTCHCITFDQLRRDNGGTFSFSKPSPHIFVNLGGTEVGTIIRIDNYLESLTEYISKIGESENKLREKEIEIKAELGKDESYTDKIEELKKQLKNIDKKLGVKK